MTTNTRNNKKHLRFAATPSKKNKKVVPVESWRHYSKGEWEAVWVTDEEFEEMHSTNEADWEQEQQLEEERQRIANQNYARELRWRARSNSTSSSNLVLSTSSSSGI